MIAAFALLMMGYVPLAVSELKCELAVNPMNVDVEHPRLSWIVSSPEEGQKQTGYRILVADTEMALSHNRGNLWDSGQVSSSETIQIPYAGRILRSAKEAFWKVKVWDAFDHATAWSPPGKWTMGLQHSADWKAKWIGAPVSEEKAATLLFRKEFSISKPIKRALCFASGLGQYEMWLNGRKVGDDWLTPGWTQYAKTVLADSYDVTSLLSTGRNSAAIHVGNGMYDMSADKRGGQQTNSLGARKAICHLLLEFEDGTAETIGTDGSWRCSPSPETYSGVYGGEDWDERLDQPGWKLANFNDRSWLPATIQPAPTGILRGLTHANPPLRLIEVRKPIKTSTPKPNVLVIDLGQNAPYVPKITVKGEPGTCVKMWPAEVLNPDGTVNQQTMRAGKLASYTLKGGAVETWNPSFWYVGSQFWQVEAFDSKGNPIDPKSVLKRFVGLMVHADVRSVGTFGCSNRLFNQIHNLIWWAMCGNFASVISDCPHREKSGWLEQDHLVGDGLMYSFDMGPMFRKVIQDMADTQLPSGMVPTMAPEYFLYEGGFRDSVEWGGASLLLPEMTQRWYGARGLVADHYAAMKRYVDYLGTQAKEGILANGLGDWNGGGTDPRTPVAITDTAYYFDLVRTLSRFAGSMGRIDDANHYQTLSEDIRRRFNAKFYDPATGKVGTGSQSAQAVALDFGIIDKTNEQKAFAQVMADVELHSYGVSCGEVGHPALLRVLTKFGRADVVATIHLQTDKPGYGYQVKRGLTTLAECWDASLNSYNHFMLGHLMEWLYSDLVGIRPDESGIAFSKIVIQPRIIPQLTWAKASYDSVRGRIACSWKTAGNKFHMDIEIPANTTATVYVPTRSASSIRLGFPDSRAFGVFFSQKPQDGYEAIHVVSGRYSFDSAIH